jgi:hypothetical protein
LFFWCAALQRSEEGDNSNAIAFFFFLVAALERSEEGDSNGCGRLLFFLFFFFLLKCYNARSRRGLLPLNLLPCNEAKAIDRVTAVVVALSFDFAAL